MLSSRTIHRTEGLKKIVKILKFQKPFHLNISTVFQFLWRNKMLFNIPKQAQKHQQNVKKYPVLLIWHKAYKQDQFNDRDKFKRKRLSQELRFSLPSVVFRLLSSSPMPKRSKWCKKGFSRDLSIISSCTAAKFFSTVGLYKTGRGPFIAYD